MTLEQVPEKADVLVSDFRANHLDGRVGAFEQFLGGRYSEGLQIGARHSAELGAIHSTHTGQIAFDDITFDSPYSILRVRTGTWLCSLRKLDVNIDNMHR